MSTREYKDFCESGKSLWWLFASEFLAARIRADQPLPQPFEFVECAPALHNRIVHANETAAQLVAAMRNGAVLMFDSQG
jgi:hypothetical protein